MSGSEWMGEMREEREGTLSGFAGWRAEPGGCEGLPQSSSHPRAVRAQLTDSRRLMIELICGGGLRLSELTRLRVKDIDFDAATITVRGSSSVPLGKAVKRRCGRGHSRP